VSRRLVVGLVVATAALLCWQALTTGRIEEAEGCGFDGAHYCAVAEGEAVPGPFSRRPLVPWLVRALSAGPVLDRFLAVDVVALGAAAALTALLVSRLAPDAPRARRRGLGVVVACVLLLQPLTAHAAFAYPAQTDAVALALALGWLVLLLDRRWASLPMAVLLCLAREAWGPVVVAVVAVDVLLDRSRWRVAVATVAGAAGAVLVDLTRPTVGDAQSYPEVVRHWLATHLGSGGGAARLGWMVLTGLGLVPLLLLARRVPRDRSLALLGTAAAVNAVLAVVGGNDTARLLLPTFAVLLALTGAAVAREPRYDLALGLLVAGTLALWRPWTVPPTETTAFLGYFTPYYSAAGVFTRRLVLDATVACVATAATWLACAAPRPGRPARPR
jgi:hypothetical protein